ncbi:MAG: DNA polymerase III subunit delta' [Syntrophorhabdaceae bacterium]|nr:DNA polymerase III subunit delta' [Syntrophorhabdaceae bacterium]
MGFDNVIGHKKQKAFLYSTLEKGRLPHAFLFTGPDGVGKKKVALEFIKMIFCENGDGCGRCRPCLKVEHKNHPDFISIENTQSIGIDESRMISREIQKPPFEANMRAILIDDAHNMTPEAYNALLKTLEEPPPFNIFFLISQSEKEIPLTIRSRCGRVAFGPLSSSEIRDFFQGIQSIGEEKAQLITYLAQGSIGSGFFWMDVDNLSFRHRIIELITGKKRSFLQVTSIAERITRSQKDTNMFLSFMLTFFRDLYLIRESRRTNDLINIDMRGLFDGDYRDYKWIINSINKIQETLSILKYNINRLLSVETLLLNIMEHRV